MQREVSGISRARLVGWFLVAASVVAPRPAHAEDPPPRWQEMAYGVSLTPPEGSAQFEGPRVIWADPDGFSISFEIVYSETRSNLEQFTTVALTQVGFSRSNPRLVTADGEAVPRQPVPERIAERPGIRMFFEIAADKPGEPAQRYGQAIVMLEPHAAVVLKLHAHEGVVDAAQRAFQAVLDSMRIPSPHDLNDLRESWVEAGDAWLKTVTTPQLAAALPDEQWFRLVIDDRDVGHLRLGRTVDPQVIRGLGYDPPGVCVRYNLRQFFDEQTLDTESRFYLHDDGRREEWSTITTLRSPHQHGGLPGAAGRPGAITWTEIGTRSDRTIERATRWGKETDEVHVLAVVNDAPPPSLHAMEIEKKPGFLLQGRVRSSTLTRDADARSAATTQEWVVPDRAYLSQVHVLAFAGLLPKEEADYCFSAYHPQTGKPGLRTVRVRPQPDGTVVVLDRPTSKLSPATHVYDAEGNLLRRTLPSGLTFLPTTPEQLAELWGVKP